VRRDWEEVFRDVGPFPRSGRGEPCDLPESVRARAGGSAEVGGDQAAVCGVVDHHGDQWRRLDDIDPGFLDDRADRGVRRRVHDQVEGAEASDFGEERREDAAR
jgi:hypothetical protein